MAEEKTGIYLLAGLAAVGVIAYFLIKPGPQPPPPGEGKSEIVDWYLTV